MKLSFTAALLLSQALPAAALSYDEAQALAERQSPALAAQQAALSGAEAAQGAASALPDPRLTVGIENLPVSGMDRWSFGRDFMTMRRIGLMQEVPNRTKREARVEGAQARMERERALLGQALLQLREAVARNWLDLQFVGQRQAALTEMLAENQRLQDTLPARVSAGTAAPSELLMARQEALALADRRDDMSRDEAKARAALRRLVGPRADESLQGTTPLAPVQPERLRQQVQRAAELAVYPAMQTMARADLREAEAEARGDWSWELAYSRRGRQWGDMVSVQLSFDLPWQKQQRQQPLISAKQRDTERVAAEADEAQRRVMQAVEEQLAALAALDRQFERLRDLALPLGQQRTALALAAYEARRGELGAVLNARRELLETRLRALDLDAQRSDLSLRLNHLIAE